jgi:CRP/FNR family transcriptional regulator
MRAGLTDGLFPFLAGLTKAGREELGALAPARAGAEKRVLRRGDPANGAYLVLRGALRVYYVTSDGREATLYRVEPGGTCVLALGATFNDEPYPAWVDAGPKGGEFVRVPGDVFHRLLDSEHAFRSFVFGAMSSRLFELMCTLEEAGSLDVEKRVARYLLRRSEHDPRESGPYVRASQRAIASELGTAREVVFRALRALSVRKLIETGRMRVRILDVEGLSRAAGR